MDWPDADMESTVLGLFVAVEKNMLSGSKLLDFY
jgi:hypothetical protein